MAKDSDDVGFSAGDNVSVIKDLKAKGASTTLKRGTATRNVKLTNKDSETEAEVDKFGTLVLKTEFLKKVWDFFCVFYSF